MALSATTIFVFIKRIAFGTALFCFSACGPVDLFTGQWQSIPGSCQSEGPIPSCTEVAIGQYGNDGAGIMRVYLNDAFNVPWPTCPCIPLRDGKMVGNAMTLVADLTLCPNLADSYPDQITITIESVDDFIGTLDVQGLGDPSNSTKIQLDRLEDDLVKFDINHPQRRCDTDTEAGTGFGEQ